MSQNLTGRGLCEPIGSYTNIINSSLKYNLPNFNLLPSTTTLRTLSKRDIVLQLQRSLGITLSRHKLHTELVLDGKHRVIAQVLAVLVENLSSQGLVSLVLNLFTR